MLVQICTLRKHRPKVRICKRVLRVNVLHRFVYLGLIDLEILFYKSFASISQEYDKMIAGKMLYQ